MEPAGLLQCHLLHVKWCLSVIHQCSTGRGSCLTMKSQNGTHWPVSLSLIACLSVIHVFHIYIFSLHFLLTTVLEDRTIELIMWPFMTMSSCWDGMRRRWKQKGTEFSTWQNSHISNVADLCIFLAEKLDFFIFFNLREKIKKKTEKKMLSNATQEKALALNKTIWNESLWSSWCADAVWIIFGQPVQGTGLEGTPRPFQRYRAYRKSPGHFPSREQARDWTRTAD